MSQKCCHVQPQPGDMLPSHKLDTLDHDTNMFIYVDKHTDYNFFHEAGSDQESMEQSILFCFPLASSSCSNSMCHIICFREPCGNSSEKYVWKQIGLKPHYRFYMSSSRYSIARTCLLSDQIALPSTQVSIQ